MFRISKKTAIKASIAAIVSMAISLSAALILVPILGGHPDGPGFWMSVVCPLVIAWPASAYQFNQNEQVRAARDAVAGMHSELERLHRELTAAHEELRQKSRFDALTGGLNRETFLAELEAKGGSVQPSALLIADADHFKRINDTFGHQCGDAALRGIGLAIASTLRPRDFWGRIGGEEFAIFLAGADTEMALAIADMIRLATLAVDLHADGERVPLSISIGGAVASSGFESRTLIANADRRLYSAKRAGRNRIVLEDDSEEEAA
jgi:diguanylate cyclase (GGDEF)-like protein